MSNCHIIRDENRPMMVSRTIFLDPNISLEAKGFFIIALIKTENEEGFSVESSKKLFPNEEKWRNIIKE